MNGLEPIDVFLDASVFIGLNYDYTSPLFVALRDRVSQGRARLIIPSSTVEEVKAHIKKDVASSAQAIKKARTDARVLRNISSIDFANLFSNIDIEALAAELVAAFDAFLLELNTEVVQIEQADLSTFSASTSVTSLPLAQARRSLNFQMHLHFRP